ncbi:NAD-dependent epimerase/dehydratase family protein [Pseudomonas sp. BGr12]|uniref:NAD-dependent epimerase/dehydratase family protein n=1 Tax=unclassified Pseudomonas TaxID=196821 RepID=UPI00177AEDE2|nr:MULTISPECIES: GDP-mannose 4,6-dehydratase [unclassified Pseudomonas]MBD9501703.1 GDP-mannose 4,6-dehydratase [Pseudomonas sp. PDM17]MDL2427320.1 GDP-mannose 4,6-dehydratase [Pseudomonas sp. BJa5]
MPTALVTGASGFTGSYMVDALKQRGFYVVGLGSEATHADETLACDLTDMAAVRTAIQKAQPDWVIHLAALAFVGHEDQEAFYRVNVFGTLNLLSALAELEKSPKRVLIASSANVYGTPGIEVISEDICPAPVNHYACSKLAMEHMVANWFDRLPIVIARPFNYTGPGQSDRFLIPKIVSHFAQQKPVIELGNLDVSRDFSDVRDVVEAYLHLLDSDVHSRKINVCSGKAVALREVLTMMEELAGYKITVQVNPAFVRANEIPVLRGSYEALAHTTGFTPRHDLKQTLEDMLAEQRRAAGTSTS